MILFSYSFRPFGGGESNHFRFKNKSKIVIGKTILTGAPVSIRKIDKDFWNKIIQNAGIYYIKC